MNKFEEMLERLINEDKTGAEELFHEVVVEKSRSIYENLLSEEYDEDDSDEENNDVDRILSLLKQFIERKKDPRAKEALKPVYQAFQTDMEAGFRELNDLWMSNLDAEFYHYAERQGTDLNKIIADAGLEAPFGRYTQTEDFDLDDFEVSEEGEDEDPMAAMGGDETDDLEMDVSMDDEEGEMDSEEGEVEDRVEDLEDALDELKAEFEKMMSDEGSDEEDDADMDMDTDMDMDDEDDGEEDDAEMDMDDEGDEEKEESYIDPTDQVATMREYVEKVTAKMGDNGSNTQSTVAGANDMGGTTDNIARADTENGVEANKGNLKGSSLSNQNPKDMSTGNVNVPGGKASKSMKKQPKGHGAEKKGSGESGTDSKSPLGSK